jgi:hypothetical protein
MTLPPGARLRRPRLDRYGPKRSASHFYRAAIDDPTAIGGVPLDSVERAVTAAVRLGYRVAESQIDRTTRIAKRLRTAGDEATGRVGDRDRSDKKALDATEQIIFKALMAGLGFVEGLATDRSNPLRRLATAEFRLIGSMLGLLPPETTAKASSQAPEPVPAPPGENERSGRDAPRRAPSGHLSTPQVQHAAGRNGTGARRAVKVVAWELAREQADEYPLIFYREGGQSTINAVLRVQPSGVMLTVKTTRKTAPGSYKTAICDETGVQIGYIEIHL